MKSKLFAVEVLGLLLLTLQVPWPGPSVFKISCPRDNARVVRKIVTHKWTPVLKRYGVALPIECPFHKARDVYAPQEEAKKRHRASQWTCGLCGKSFYEEKYLDQHFDTRHNNVINMAEDAVCLADYCDIMRCEILLTKDPKSILGDDDDRDKSTDVEIWREKATYHRNALTVTTGTSARRKKKGEKIDLRGRRTENRDKQSHADNAKCPPDEAKDTDETGPKEEKNDTKKEDKCNATNAGALNVEHLVDSVMPPKRQERFSELKANCNPEELLKLKVQCETLIRDCISGLLIHLSPDDFLQIEDELNKAVCWFLTCDRYWQDSYATEPKTFPWHLLFLTVMVLSLGLCLCYYVVWVLFDGDDSTSVASTSDLMTEPSSPSKHLLDNNGSTMPSDDYANEQFIYVTYPPELKRKFLESCYNRTTRL